MLNGLNPLKNILKVFEHQQSLALAMDMFFATKHTL